MSYIQGRAGSIPHTDTQDFQASQHSEQYSRGSPLHCENPLFLPNRLFPLDRPDDGGSSIQRGGVSAEKVHQSII